jgi:DNA-binding MarR family transcriptional regulator
MPSRRTRPAASPAKPDNGRAIGRELDFGALRGIAGFHLARASVMTLDAFERHIGTPLRLHKVDFSALMLLDANPGASPKQLALALDIAAPKLTALLDRLQQRGLLERLPNPSDGRSQRVVLTRRGQQLARDAALAAQPMEDEMRLRLTHAEHAMLIELLGKLAHGGPAQGTTP